MSDLYLSGKYSEKNPTYHIEHSPFKAQQILKMVNKHGLHPGSVCDVGCGAGEVLRQLLELPRGDGQFYLTPPPPPPL